MIEKIISSVPPRIIGVAAGTIVALLYIIPKSRTEWFTRTTVSVIVGVIFTTPLREYLGWALTIENIIASGFLASFSSWWGVGAIHAGFRKIRNGKFL